MGSFKAVFILFSVLFSLTLYAQDAKPVALYLRKKSDQAFKSHCNGTLFRVHKKAFLVTAFHCVLNVDSLEFINPDHLSYFEVELNSKTLVYPYYRKDLVFVRLPGFAEEDTDTLPEIEDLFSTNLIEKMEYQIQGHHPTQGQMTLKGKTLGYFQIAWQDDRSTFAISPQEEAPTKDSTSIVAIGSNFKGDARGLSGSPVFDSEGKLIGVLSAAPLTDQSVLMFSSIPDATKLIPFLKNEPTEDAKDPRKNFEMLVDVNKIIKEFSDLQKHIDEKLKELKKTFEEEAKSELERSHKMLLEAVEKPFREAHERARKEAKPKKCSVESVTLKGTLLEIELEEDDTGIPLKGPIASDGSEYGNRMVRNLYSALLGAKEKDQTVTVYMHFLKIFRIQVGSRSFDLK